MSLISISDLSFSYHNNYESIFNKVSIQIDTDWKLGLIGANGKGKTTLLKILNGELEYSGNISSKVDFSYFPYDISNEIKNDLVINIMNSYLPTKELWEFKKELSLLNFSEDDLYFPYNLLSNGQQIKIMLAILFLKDNNFLLIDEPTNHLDIETRLIVAEYLNQKKGFILVSHDRNFLNNCIDHVLSINNASINLQQGNYDTYKQNKDNQDNYEIVKNEKLKKEIKRLEIGLKKTASWSNEIEKSKNRGSIARNGFIDAGVKPDKGHIGAKAAKMMQKSKNISRRKEKSLEQQKQLLKDVEVIPDLKIWPIRHHSNPIVTFSDVSLVFDKEILKGLSFDINYQERIALIGPNGSGKTSILKILLNELEPTSGSIYRASNLKVAYVSQDTSHLKGSLKEFILENKIDETLFYSILRKLGFNRNQFDKNIEDFSSGQKKKVLIAHSLTRQAHLYILDEALNYLDINARIQLENLLLEYQPTIIFVEHDLEFVNSVATKIIKL